MMFLFGASGHGAVILDILATMSVEVKGYIDDNRNLVEFYGKPVYHSLFQAGFTLSEDALIISVGNNLIRRRLSRDLEVVFGKASHYSSVISNSASIGDGSVVMAHATINAGSKVGNHCIVNTNASVDHDCVLEDFVHISPNVALAGDVRVGEGSHLGIGSCAIQGVRIGKWAVIGAGAVVIRDVPDYAVVVGSPGRVIKFRDELQ